MSDHQKFTFTGTLMDGPEIDIFELSGLTLTDEETDKLCWDTNQRAILLECPSLEEIEVDETNAPLYSDVYYRYEAPSKEKLQEELKMAIRAILG